MTNEEIVTLVAEFDLTLEEAKQFQESLIYAIEDSTDGGVTLVWEDDKLWVVPGRLQ